MHRSKLADRPDRRRILNELRDPSRSGRRNLPGGRIVTIGGCANTMASQRYSTLSSITNWSGPVGIDVQVADLPASDAPPPVAIGKRTCPEAV